MSDNLVRLADNIHYQELDGEMIVLNLNTERYLSLSESATLMLHTLLESDSTEQATKKLLQIYEVDATTLSRDLSDFMDKLVQLGLITIGSNDT